MRVPVSPLYINTGYNQLTSIVSCHRAYSCARKLAVELLSPPVNVCLSLPRSSVAASAKPAPCLFFLNTTVFLNYDILLFVACTATVKLDIKIYMILFSNLPFMQMLSLVLLQQEIPDVCCFLVIMFLILLTWAGFSFWSLQTDALSIIHLFCWLFHNLSLLVFYLVWLQVVFLSVKLRMTLCSCHVRGIWCQFVLFSLLVWIWSSCAHFYCSLLLRP